jgi:hypothetical protein
LLTSILEAFFKVFALQVTIESNKRASPTESDKDDSGKEDKESQENGVWQKRSSPEIVVDDDSDQAVPNDSTESITGPAMEETRKILLRKVFGAEAASNNFFE